MSPCCFYRPRSALCADTSCLFRCESSGYSVYLGVVHSNTRAVQRGGVCICASPPPKTFQSVTLIYDTFVIKYVRFLCFVFFPSAICQSFFYGSRR